MAKKSPEQTALPENNSLPLNIKESEQKFHARESTMWKTVAQDKEGQDRLVALKQVHREQFATEEEMRKSQEFYKFLKEFPGFGKFVPDTLYFKARATPDSAPQLFML